MAKIWVLDQFLRRDLSLLVSLRKPESPKLLWMEETWRCPEQSVRNNSRNNTGRLPHFRRNLLQKRKELKADSKSWPKFYGPIRQYHRGTQLQAKKTLGSILSMPVAVPQTLAGVYSGFPKRQACTGYFLCYGLGSPYDCGNWDCGAHDFSQQKQDAVIQWIFRCHHFVPPNPVDWIHDRPRAQEQSCGEKFDSGDPL